VSGVVVIGAGTLGTEIIRRLQTPPVAIIDRRAAPTGELASNWVRHDLRDTDGLARLVSELSPSGIVYTAGLSTSQSGDEPGLARTVHCDAAVAALDALHDHARFLYLSSFAVYGAVPGDSPVREAQPLKPLGTYGRLKADAERDLQRTRGNRDLVILRSAGLYGSVAPEGSLSQQYMLRLVLDALRGHVTVPGPDVDLDELWFVDDAARVVAALIESPLRERCRSTVLNGGPGHRTAGRDLHAALRALNRNAVHEIGPTPEGFMATARLDVAALSDLVGNPATTSLPEGVRVLAQRLERQQSEDRLVRSER
jgi:nucleoside-diphosphate-sugar epimerase